MYCLFSSRLVVEHYADVQRRSMVYISHLVFLIPVKIHHALRGSGYLYGVGYVLFNFDTYNSEVDWLINWLGLLLLYICRRARLGNMLFNWVKSLDFELRLRLHLRIMRNWEISALIMLLITRLVFSSSCYLSKAWRLGYVYRTRMLLRNWKLLRPTLSSMVLMLFLQ